MKLTYFGSCRIIRTQKSPPIWVSSKLSFDGWRFEVELWNDWTNILKNRRGCMVLVAIPICDPSGAREKINKTAIQNNDVNISSDTSVADILKSLDKNYQKDDAGAVCEAYLEFVGFSKDPNQAMAAYITEFDRKVSQLQIQKIVIPEVALAMQLLYGADLSSNDRKIVLTAVDFEKKDNLLSQMKCGLKKYFGKEMTPSSKVGVEVTKISIKSESVDIVEDVNAVRNCNMSWKPKKSGSVLPQNTGNSNWYRFYSTKGKEGNAAAIRGGTRRGNPLDKDGNQTRCWICESVIHCTYECPHKKNVNRGKTQTGHVNVAESDYAFISCRR